MLSKLMSLIAEFVLLGMVVTAAYALDEDATGIIDLPLLADDLSQEIDEFTDPDTLAQQDFEDPEVDIDVLYEADTAVAGISFQDQTVVKDVILVLDNSGSMKKNDPEFLTSQAVTHFISGLDDSTRMGIVIFDQDISLAVPLIQISTASRQTLLNSLDRINYRGLFTDIPAAIERAIYELKNNGRDDASKLIIFMTDGIVDTGNADVDLEKTKWLKDSLAADAADAGIKIFGIAFTEAADFQLIQSLAQKTDGEYFRALKPEDLKTVFERVNTVINQVMQPEIIAATTAPQVQQPVLQAPQQPIIIEVPVSQPISQSRPRSIIIIVAAIVLIVTVLAILILLVRRGRGTAVAEAGFESEAYLNDIHGFTSQVSYKLGGKPTMLGRVAGKETDHLDYIVIPETTIGRRHALIDFKDFAYWIIDQGSINGTFVNDKLISSEVRLKHGDKVRLHKFEFEFVMPEMVDAGMTVVSSTMLGTQTPDFSSDTTEIKAGAATDAGNGIAAADIDFDLTAGAEVEDIGITDSEAETSVSGNDPGSSNEDVGSEEETLIPGNEFAQSEQDGSGSEDETLMPGQFELQEDDATLRKELSDENISLDNFIDLGKLDSNDDKDDKDN